MFWTGAGIGIVSVVLGVLRSGLVEEGNQDRIFTTDVREFYLIRAESPFQNLTIFSSFSHATLRAQYLG